ncbi:DUF547 domain-containing protein [Candidatus Uabimicrobium sp. HlEnr_7]|uniref:DUF547 domain-containing protein n=1 Tax=Candidatus Uabimicrobium helgolandensis TaxID=3095367 RepID=UPI00355719FB
MKKTSVIILITVAVLIIVGCSLIRTLFYPPVVVAGEIYQDKGKTLSFLKWNEDLQKYVKSGFVSYAKWKNDETSLDHTIDFFKTMQVDKVARDHLLAAYINAYNAFTVKLILEYYPNITSINDIPKAKRWDAIRWQVGKETFSLNQLEHDILRKNFIEPRIHFGIVCASIGCPHLYNKAYDGDIIEEQLTAVAKDFFSREENLKVDGSVVYVSSILDWFRGDFVREELATKLKWFGEDYQKASENIRLLMFICRFAPENIKNKISENYSKWSIKYATYDWNLNGK